MATAMYVRFSQHLDYTPHEVAFEGYDPYPTEQDIRGTVTALGLLTLA